MKPREFGESNGDLLGGPAEKYGVPVQDLKVFRDGTEVISCWRPTWRERFSMLFRGRIWLRVRGRATHPPVAIMGRKTVFRDTGDGDAEHTGTIPFAGAQDGGP